MGTVHAEHLYERVIFLKGEGLRAYRDPWDVGLQGASRVLVKGYTGYFEMSVAPGVS